MVAKAEMSGRAREVAVTITTPSETAVTIPFADTVARRGSAELHVTPRSAPESAVTCATMMSVSPGLSVAFTGATPIPRIAGSAGGAMMETSSPQAAANTAPSTTQKRVNREGTIGVSTHMAIGGSAHGDTARPGAMRGDAKVGRTRDRGQSAVRFGAGVLRDVTDTVTRAP